MSPAAFILGGASLGRLFAQRTEPDRRGQAPRPGARRSRNPEARIVRNDEATLPVGPRTVAPKTLHYATVHKTRANNRVVPVEARVVYGTEEGYGRSWSGRRRARR
jgi:hypothetical protein